MKSLFGWGASKPAETPSITQQASQALHDAQRTLTGIRKGSASLDDKFSQLNSAQRQVAALKALVDAMPEDDLKNVWRAQAHELTTELERATAELLRSQASSARSAQRHPAQAPSAAAAPAAAAPPPRRAAAPSKRPPRDPPAPALALTDDLFAGMMFSPEVTKPREPVALPQPPHPPAAAPSAASSASSTSATVRSPAAFAREAARDAAASAAALPRPAAPAMASQRSNSAGDPPAAAPATAPPAASEALKPTATARTGASQALAAVAAARAARASSLQRARDSAATSTASAAAPSRVPTTSAASPTPPVAPVALTKQPSSGSAGRQSAVVNGPLDEAMFVSLDSSEASAAPPVDLLIPQPDRDELLDLAGGRGPSQGANATSTVAAAMGVSTSGVPGNADDTDLLMAPCALDDPSHPTNAALFQTALDSVVETAAWHAQQSSADPSALPTAMAEVVETRLKRIQEAQRTAEAQQASARASMRSFEERAAAATAQRSRLEEEQELSVQRDDYERAAELASSIDDLTADAEELSKRRSEAEQLLISSRQQVLALKSLEAEAWAAAHTAAQRLATELASVAAAASQAAAAAADAAAAAAAEKRATVEAQAAMIAEQRAIADGEEEGLLLEEEAAAGPLSDRVAAQCEIVEALCSQVEELERLLAEKRAELADAETVLAAEQDAVDAALAQFGPQRAALAEAREQIGAEEAALERERTELEVLAEAEGEAARAAAGSHAAVAAVLEAVDAFAADCDARRAALEAAVAAKVAIQQGLDATAREADAAHAAVVERHQALERVRGAYTATCAELAAAQQRCRFHQDRMHAAQARAPGIETKKQAAVTAKNFKLAASLATEAKALEGELAAERSAADAASQEEAVKLAEQDARLAELQTLEAETAARERAAAHARWRCAAASRFVLAASLNDAVAEARYGDAAEIEADLKATEVSVATLQEQHSFDVSELDELLASFAPTGAPLPVAAAHAQQEGTSEALPSRLPADADAESRDRSSGASDAAAADAPVTSSARAPAGDSADTADLGRVHEQTCGGDAASLEHLAELAEEVAEAGTDDAAVAAEGGDAECGELEGADCGLPLEILDGAGDAAEVGGQQDACEPSADASGVTSGREGALSASVAADAGSAEAAQLRPEAAGEESAEGGVDVSTAESAGDGPPVAADERDSAGGDGGGVAEGVGEQAEGDSQQSEAPQEEVPAEGDGNVGSLGGDGDDRGAALQPAAPSGDDLFSGMTLM